MYRGERAGNLALAGAAMGETSETAAAGARSDSGQVPTSGLGGLMALPDPFDPARPVTLAEFDAIFSG